MSTYFISDIHLSNNTHELSNLLLRFLNETAPHAEALYILGDMFAIWFGDDLEHNFALPIIRAIQNLKNLNIPVYFMPGNRDFLLGKSFCENAGMQLLADPTIFTLYGKQCLLTHGDLLCSQDQGYQRFRKFVQNPITKKVFLSIPKSLRLRIGQWVRRKAMHKYAEAQEGVQKYDADPATVLAWFDQHHVDLIIHGHTHQPALYSIGTRQRVVLGDWSKNSAFILKVDQNSLELYDVCKK